jgi:L-threonylcarbamoyladenylate synthase
MAEIGSQVGHVVALLRAGECVGLPTETVYGLAANAFHTRAVTQIFEIKRRPHFDPLILHIHSSRQMLDLTSHIPNDAVLLAQAFWPGPLTLVLPRSSQVPDLVTSGLDSVALRMPAHPLTRQVLQKLTFPLAMPSANPFGYISPTTAKHVQEQLGDKIPYILDGGPSEVGIESTIVGFDGNNAYILRPGGITEQQIVSVIGRLVPQPEATGTPLAPGQLKSHYAPRTPLTMLTRAKVEALEYERRTAVLVFGAPLTQYPHTEQFNLSPSENLAEAAHNLFAFMRTLDQAGFRQIYAHWLPETGLGIPINDRLKRAAGLG